MRLLYCFIFFLLIHHNCTHINLRKNSANSGFLLVRQNSHTLSTQKKFNPLDYLKKYGYLNIKMDENESSFEDSRAPQTMIHIQNQSEIEEQAEKIRNSIKNFQRLHRLNVTGTIDKATMEKMKSPRCGVPDLAPNQDHKRRRFKRNENDDGNKLWDKTDLIFKIKNQTPDMEFKLVREIIARAFKDWSDATHFRFIEAANDDEDVDLVISFENGDHMDGSPFDGLGGELAHAFYPRDGRVHFDEAEYFTENSTEGVNLRMMATHEIGHAIGLEHNFEPNSIMYPEYIGYKENFSLSEYDLQLVKKFFNLSDDQIGRAAKLNNDSLTLTTKKSFIYLLYKDNRRNDKLVWHSKSPCTKTFQGIFLSPKNTFYVITDNSTFWEYNTFLRYWSSYSIDDAFQDLVKGVKGGVKCKNNITWFFKDRIVWAYKGYSLLREFPTTMNFARIQSDFNYNVIEKNGNIFLVNGYYAYHFDTANLTLLNDNPFSLGELFPGIPKNVDSSVFFDGQYYFFKNIWVYRFDPISNKIISGDPKLKSEIFPPCVKHGKKKPIF